MYQHILVPVDGSELADRALDHAVKLAAALKARLSLVYVRMPYAPVVLPNLPYPSSVLPSPETYEQAEAEHAAHLLAKSAMRVHALDGECAMLHPENADAWKGILETAERESCDLICMASHGRGGLGSLILGSQTQKVLAHSTLPVLVVR